MLGTFGISEDGSYVYFVAESALAGGATAGQGNLYEWHEGEPISLVAALDAGELGDQIDWRDFFNEEEKGSRVTPNGQTVLFGSRYNLTPYNSAGHVEFYVYSALSRALRCISCNPNAPQATEETYLSEHSAVGPVPRNAFLTRNLSADGGRVFFQTGEALVPQDTNGQMDVYEWEREGEGSCPNGQSAGCVSLISTGTSSAESYFGDASSEGENVLFFTRQSLVGEDQDDNVDLYDARIDGGFLAQNPSPPLPPCKDEGCLGNPTEPVALGVPSSAAFASVGNLAPLPTPKSTTKKKRKAKPKPLTRAQRFARALKKACKAKPKHRRRACEAQARKKYRR